MSVTTGEATSDTVQKSRFRGVTWLDRVRQVGILLALLMIMGVFSFLTPIFLTPSNLTNILVQSTITAIIGIGMTLVIIQGGIDLSVGPLVALVVVVVATQMVKGMPVPQAILVGLILGALAGIFNGVMIAYVGLQPFIVTLGTMSLFRGSALVYTNGDPIFKVPAAFRSIFNGEYLGVPGPIVFMLLVALIAFILLNYTRLGIYIKSIGGNEEAARMSGVNVRLNKLLTYTLCSVFTALAALVLLGRLGAAEPIAGSGYELDAIAAAAVGGTSMSGGRGNIPGTILGALILGSLRNGLTLMNVQAFYQLLASGGIILVAVTVDRFTRGQNL
jgi:ribose transport system permease protein